MTQATICFLVKDGKVALAKKKEKVGAGFLNGYGGMQEGEETLLECAIRETWQESGVIPIEGEIELVAKMDFYRGSKLTYPCTVYLIHDWMGEPKETSEMGPPEVFSIDKLPLEQMRVGDHGWIPIVLKGKKIKGFVKYSEDGECVLGYRYEECTSDQLILGFAK